MGIWALWYGNEQKVGGAEKKLRLTQKMAHRVYQGDMSLPVVTCHNRPSEAHGFGYGGLQAALQASPFACMELSTICHLRWRLARPHISATRLFVLFHPSQATIPLNLTKSSSRYQKEP